MNTLKSVMVETMYGPKTLSVVCGDIRNLDKPLDVMTVSASTRHYRPVPRTMIGALEAEGISVSQLARNPAADMRNFGGAWLSRQVVGSPLPIQRIGCVEFQKTPDFLLEEKNTETTFLNVMKVYFHLLDIAVDVGIKINTLGLPILGTGDLHIPFTLALTPILNECVQFLKRNESIREITIIEKNAKKAEVVAQKLAASYSLMRSASAKREETPEAEKKYPLTFLSYSSKDRNVADNLCAKLEQKGIPVWYAPRNVDKSDYASAIVNAIARCGAFVVILSQNSLASEHVLNEIDLAFQETKRGVRFFPLKLDHEQMGPAFKYYLSRQHWMDATLPPLEKRLDEFVEKLMNELDQQ